MADIASMPTQEVLPAMEFFIGTQEEEPMGLQPITVQQEEPPQPPWVAEALQEADLLQEGQQQRQQQQPQASLLPAPAESAAPTTEFAMSPAEWMAGRPAMSATVVEKWPSALQPLTGQPPTAEQEVPSTLPTVESLAQPVDTGDLAFTATPEAPATPPFDRVTPWPWPAPMHADSWMMVPENMPAPPSQPTTGASLPTEETGDAGEPAADAGEPAADAGEPAADAGEPDADADLAK